MYTGRDVEVMLAAREKHIREEEARECLAIARSYAGSWLSPTADEIVTALERRVNEHAPQKLPELKKSVGP